MKKTVYDYDWYKKEDVERICQEIKNVKVNYDDLPEEAKIKAREEVAEENKINNMLLATRIGAAIGLVITMGFGYYGVHKFFEEGGDADKILDKIEQKRKARKEKKSKKQKHTKDNIQSM